MAEVLQEDKLYKGFYIHADLKRPCSLHAQIPNTFKNFSKRFDLL